MAIEHVKVEMMANEMNDILIYKEIPFAFLPNCACKFVADLSL